MKLAIMQPYIFPYIGYFQLIYETDIFVFYDDVNFINRGWINRNKILINGEEQIFTIPCKDISQNKLIKDIELHSDPKYMQKLMATVKMAYNKAPYFATVYPLIESVFLSPDTHTISEMAIHSVTNVCDYLGLQKKFKISSTQYNNRELKKADRLIDICHVEGASNYINPPGGKAIYTKEYYKERGVGLQFLIPQSIEYAQFKNHFVPWLSIVDVLMFNCKEDINNKILPSYHIE